MSTSSLFPMLSQSTKVYTLVTMNGKTSLAVRVDDHWEVDDTCRSINELLHAGLVSPDAVRGWVQNEKALCVH